MRAVTFRDVGDFQIEDVPKPSLQAASDVLLKVTLGAISNASSNSRHYSAGELVSTYSAALPRVDVDHAYHLDPDDRANSGLPSPVRPL